MRQYELLEGEKWRGNYGTRRAAMADAELLAAKRGQTVRWARIDGGATAGFPEPPGEASPYTIRVAADSAGGWAQVLGDRGS